MPRGWSGPLRCSISLQTIRLHAGEMTAQEMRTVRAVLAWLQGRIRAEARKP